MIEGQFLRKNWPCIISLARGFTCRKNSYICQLNDNNILLHNLYYVKLVWFYSSLPYSVPSDCSFMD